MLRFYPGTLNLKLGRAEWLYLYQNANCLIQPFVLKERRYSAVRALRIEIEGKLPGAIVFPEKGLRPGVVEIASDRYLRDALNLRDGDIVAFPAVVNPEPPNERGLQNPARPGSFEYRNGTAGRK